MSKREQENEVEEEEEKDTFGKKMKKKLDKVIHNRYGREPTYGIT